MHSWQPTNKDRKLIELTASMCTGTLLGNGVADRKTFISNLHMIADELEELNTSKKPTVRQQLKIDKEMGRDE